MNPHRPPPTHRLPFFRRRGAPRVEPEPGPDSEQTPTDDTMGAAASKAPWTPSYADVRVARAILKTLKLPTELTLDILDRARYWPTREFGGYAASAQAGARIIGLVNVMSPGIGRELGANKDEVPKIKEIEFNIKSRDQGWTSQGTEGTYNTSSWLEVFILRPRALDEGTHDLAPDLVGRNRLYPNIKDFQDTAYKYGWHLISRPPSPEQDPQSEEEFAWHLQANKVASRDTRPYNIVWAEDGHTGNEGSGNGEGFVKILQEGDQVVVLGRAKVCREVIYCSSDFDASFYPSKIGIWNGTDRFV
ncbi:hypothetical protein K504DRAFT_462716 [Pleomassaria siparia CBS 279.74]|uniref:Uncharacterized protein n=1 Tax=Pleomassaria siparia CBS 279.74 TaxID=1314801 RepID=A0A6G1JU40_9PLEO|nr:hypothetical protein K504DRAFT_462716 [Pleomassaria siparia CBS 279.74]